jgi:thiamine-phosphate pyrophosphorylase
VISIINDRADIALLADADGVHVGQTDSPARDVRKLDRHEKIVGVCTHTSIKAKRAYATARTTSASARSSAATTQDAPISSPAPLTPRQIAEQQSSSTRSQLPGITEQNVDEVWRPASRPPPSPPP